MQIKLLKDLRWSPDGCSVVTISSGYYSGDDIPERAQVIAGQLGIIDVIEGGDDKFIPPEPAKKSKK